MNVVPIELLGGAVGRATRVRGFAPWRPQRETLRLLDQVRAILDEYLAYLPLTLRQIFYRLVGAYAYPKTEAAYARLGEHLNRARRAEIIPMDAIRDDGGTRAGGTGWPSVAAFLDHLRGQASGFRLDRTIGQPSTLIVLCEAAGMVPQLDRITDPYDVAVESSGGFDSVTDQYRLAMKIANSGRPVEVLHLGDHDPSGAHLYLSLIENIAEFAERLGGEVSFSRLAVKIANSGRPVEVLHLGDHDPSGAHLYLSLIENIAEFAERLGGEVSFSRLAVTPQQITTLNLPTAPPKETDKRAFRGDTCQIESIAPDVLSAILDDVLRARLDPTAYCRALEREREERDRLIRLIATGLPGEAAP